uniref:Negative elongation factor B n=1 Tax=Amphimedon queenslandica TaxID=400682 RepID=A0A1X7T4P6_AMPQE
MLETLSAQQPIDEKYLLEIAEKEELYNDCPIIVKRQIWQLNPGVFGEAVSPLLDQYIAEKESQLFNISEQSFFMQPVKARRQSSILKQLVEMLGTSLPLYNTLTQFLRTLFLRTRVGHYCTLRADIIMMLHEKDNVIMDSDRCHKFAWCLDACIRSCTVDEKKLRELYAFLDTIPGGDDVLEDVSMLLRDPFILYTISRSVVLSLHKMMNESKLPRESSHLESLLRLLFIGLKSASYLETKSYSGDPLEIDIIIKFLPELLSFMTESSLRLIHSKLKQDYPTYTLSSSFIRHLTSTTGAMQLTTSYSLYLIDKKDFKTLSSLLPAIASSYTESETDIFPDGYMNSVVVGVSLGRLQ